MYYKLRCKSTQFVMYYKLRNYYKLQRNTALTRLTFVIRIAISCITGPNSPLAATFLNNNLCTNSHQSQRDHSIHPISSETSPLYKTCFNISFRKFYKNCIINLLLVNQIRCNFMAHKRHIKDIIFLLRHSMINDHVNFRYLL